MRGGLGSVGGARVLVTGGSGLIGQAVVELLVSQGARVTVLDVAGEHGSTEPQQLLGSTTDAVVVAEAMRDADAVVHLAGIPGLEHGTAAEIYHVNAFGTFTVLDAAGEAGIRNIVYASSINAGGLPLNPHPVLPTRYPWNEDEHSDIADAYSLSKQANEDAARMIRRRYGAQVTGLRFPLVRDIRKRDGVDFAAHIRRVVHEDPRREACEGWSYLDASDAARAVLAALCREVADSPGILVAASRTFLSTSTQRALELIVPEVPRGDLSGRDVPIDLERSRSLLGFNADILLDDLNPDLLVDLEAVVQHG